MKYLIISIVICMGVLDGAYAQDTLYTTRNEKILIKLIEINQTHINYRLTDPKIREVFTIPINEVKQIVFASGFVRKFSDEQKQITYLPVYPIDPYSLEFGKNFIALNVLDASVGPITLSYEYTFKTGEFSMDVQGSAGTNRGNQNNNHWDANKDFSLGLGFNYYPGGQGRVAYFLGPSFEYGQLTREYWNDKITYNAFIFQTGLLIQITPHFNWSIELGLGYLSDEPYNERAIGRGAFLMGYKF